MVEEEMEGMDEEWVAMAMGNDAMVVEMLLRLRLPQAEMPRFSHAAAAAAALPVRWGVVRKRARQPAARADGWCDREGDGKAEVEAARAKVASPTTPLSWSGGAGSAGSGDGSDSSSHPRVKAAEVLQTAGGGGGGANGGAGFGCVVRLKAAAREANALRLPSKRPAKKKTIAVLKDEENKLLIERTNLENDIERLMKTYLSLVKQNKRLKMIKLPPKDVSNGKPDIVASIASEQAPQEAVLSAEAADFDHVAPQAPQEAVLPAEAADFDHVAPRSASDAKPDFLTMGAAMHEVHDSALLKDTEPLSRTANATLQSHAAKETCSFSSVPSCGEAFFIPDLNLPIDVSFAGDAA